MSPHPRFAHCSCENAIPTLGSVLHFHACSARTTRFDLFYQNIESFEYSYISGPRSVLFVFVKREQRMKPTRIRGRWCSIAGVFWISCYFGFDLILGLFVSLFCFLWTNLTTNETRFVCFIEISSESTTRSHTYPKVFNARPTIPHTQICGRWT